MWKLLEHRRILWNDLHWCHLPSAFGSLAVWVGHWDWMHEERGDSQCWHHSTIQCFFMTSTWFQLCIYFEMNVAPSHDGFDSELDVNQWMLYHMDASAASFGRGLVIGRIYNREGKLLVVCVSRLCSTRVWAPLTDSEKHRADSSLLKRLLTSHLCRLRRV